MTFDFATERKEEVETKKKLKNKIDERKRWKRAARNADQQLTCHRTRH